MDFTDDAFLVMTGQVQLQDEPLADFVNYIRDIQGNGQFPYTGNFILTGHSLGGHLVQYAARYFPSIVQQAFTFNSAGIAGSPLFTGSVVRYLSYLWSNSAVATNIIAEPGPEFISSPLSGIRPGRRFWSFIEDQRGRSSTGESGAGASDNHGMPYMLDAIAVYRVFETIARTSGSAEDEITGILEASSRYSLDSQTCLR